MKEPTKGRGAQSNTPNRFETVQVQTDWEFAQIPPGDPDDPNDTPIGPRTRFYKDHSRTVLTRNESPDVGFTASINPYRGCEHGCIYCYARPTHEYLGLSAGIDFETKVMVKENAPALLREALLAKSWVPEVINISGVTDCYQPVEKKLALTRRCIEVLSEFKNPFTIITKNHLVTRDIDLIAPMAANRAAAVFVTVTSLDPELCGILEPRTSRPAHRLEAIRHLSEAGIPVGVMVAPVIPGLTDHELPSILGAASKAGARFASYVPLRLPWAVAPLFVEWLETHFPQRKEKVLSLIRSIRGGKLNDSTFKSRMRGEGEFAEQIRALFHVYERKEGLNREELELSVDGFQRPGEQLKLF
jgi:DNA repair photolyase